MSTNIEVDRRAKATRNVITGYLTEQRDALLAAEPGVRGGHPEAIHDMRVATRRLRSTLRTFRPLLDRTRTEPLRDELRWLGRLLGAARDAGVLAGQLSAAVAAEPDELVIGPVAARIRQRLVAGLAESQDRLVAGLDSERFAALTGVLDELAAGGAGRTAGGRKRTERWALREARRALRRADRRLKAARTAPARTGTPIDPTLPPTGRDARLHSARKAYKRARYAAEAVAPLGGRRARRLVKRLKALQDVLGAHQDTVVARELLRDYGMRAFGENENTFTYGLLHARQQAHSEQALTRLDGARRRAGKRSVRRWLAR